MAHAPRSEDLQPWYKQGWPWLLIALPASAVVGGIVTVILAVNSPNALVVDDYYKEGLAINQQKQRVNVARGLQLQGLLRSDGAQLELSLSGALPMTQEALQLKLIHSTRADLDREVTLLRTGDGRYGGRVEALSPGNWYLRLAPDDQAWELRARITTNGPFQANLAPDV